MPPTPVGSAHTNGQPESLGFSEEDFDILLGKAREVFRESWGLEQNRIIDELLTRQQGKPIHLNSHDVHRVAFHYCVAVKKAADRLTTELSEAVGHQLGLGTQQQQQIRARILFFIQERTSLEAAGAVLTWVTEFFTIANPKEGEQILAQSLADAADSGLLLTSESLKILRYSTAKYGPRTPAPLRSPRGRKKGQRRRETVELERIVREVRAELLSRSVFRPSTKEIVAELAKKEAVPSPQTGERTASRRGSKYSPAEGI